MFQHFAFCFTFALLGQKRQVHIYVIYIYMYGYILIFYIYIHIYLHMYLFFNGDIGEMVLVLIVLDLSRCKKQEHHFENIMSIYNQPGSQVTLK